LKLNGLAATPGRSALGGRGRCKAPRGTGRGDPWRHLPSVQLRSGVLWIRPGHPV